MPVSIHRLDNSSWGFASSCFVCEETNSAGMRVPFFHDDEMGTVSAEFSLDEQFSGAPSYVHGGLVLAILDEAMAWAAIAVAKTFALTRTTTTTFSRPVKVGRSYRVEARIMGPPPQQGPSALLSGSGELVHADIEACALITRGTDGKTCAEAVAMFAALSSAQSSDAIGASVQGADAGYLRA